jgi:hypothetical protein
MAAPEHVPVPAAVRPRSYNSPDHVPDGWKPDRRAELTGRQPEGPRLGYQGPDQGYGLALAERFRGRLQLHPGEKEDDAISGGLAIALRRASLFGRAPVIHDLTVAFTIWGFLDPHPPDELLARRRPAFEGVGHPHHYAEGRALVDAVPDATLRLMPVDVQSAYPGRWRELLGAESP